jgi:DNA (cytosine-5)-methyltransferase 1
MTYRLLDLFSGIGGFSLGLERSGGFRTVAFCEIDPYCRRVLAKHWPEVPQYDDIRTLTAERLAADGIGVDAICGGFPCQDVSLAGRRQGLDSERSGLWSEYHRLIRELRPRHVVVENTPGLLSLGMGRVLGDLAALGFGVWWDCISAASVGADHIRDRVWIVANAAEGHVGFDGRSQEPPRQDAENVADALSSRLQGRRHARTTPYDVGKFVARVGSSIGPSAVFPREHELHQPVLGRGLHGVPHRVDRIGALGNAVGPQIPELIGRAILAAEGRS